MRRSINFFVFCCVNFSSNILDGTRALTRRCTLYITLYYLLRSQDYSALESDLQSHSVSFTVGIVPNFSRGQFEIAVKANGCFSFEQPRSKAANNCWLKLFKLVDNSTSDQSCEIPSAKVPLLFA